ncbi:MAG: DUF711 family protein [Anaerolineales bacterium]|nr:DUF711 family protein [Anaerolineales bacterium]
MKIRSITCFLDLDWPPDAQEIAATGEFLAAARRVYAENQYEVQTTRVATAPFSHNLAGRIREAPVLAQSLEEMLRNIDVSYVSLGPALPDVAGSCEIIPEILAATENVFVSGLMADIENNISMQAVRACADVIVRSAPLSPDGFANLRFTALANVPAGTPYFPASYYRAGESPAFALAIEAADLAVQAFGEAETLEQGRQTLVESIERHSQAISRLSVLLEREHGVKFLGIDFSLAPFPRGEQSIGMAFEKMGVPAVGKHGSLAATAILTEAIERADFPRLGFSGVMLPVLEDAVLAARASEGTLTVKDLLLYSCVCGTGLDTVPLPGDVTADQLSALLLDLAVMAVRLDKPLTARLMPIPGKQAGDETGFDFDFFVNSRVMPLESSALERLLGNVKAFRLNSR